MPRLNGMGPQGAGPMTGRGMGTCNATGEAAVNFSRGMGRGRGCGRGYANGYGFRGFDIQQSSEDRKEILNNRKAFLQKQLESINEQIDKL